MYAHMCRYRAMARSLSLSLALFLARYISFTLSRSLSTARAVSLALSFFLPLYLSLASSLSLPCALSLSHTRVGRSHDIITFESPSQHNLMLSHPSPSRSFSFCLRLSRAYVISLLRSLDRSLFHTPVGRSHDTITFESHTARIAILTGAVGVSRTGNNSQKSAP